MNNRIKRIITGSVWGTVLLAGIMYSPLTAFVLFFMLAMLSQYEFLKQFSGTSKPSIVLTILLGSVSYTILSSYALSWITYPFLFLLILPVILILVTELFRNSKSPLHNIQTAFMSIIYTVLPLALLNFFNGYAVSFQGVFYQLTLSFFIVIWTNDTMAYFVGMRFGKRPLFKKVSPKKSWEGFFGGLIASILMAFALAHFFEALTLYQWLLFNAITAIFGVLGDLVESMIKREAGLKDSGTILPGHGGMLDRLDSVLVAAPATLLFLVLIYNI